MANGDRHFSERYLECSQYLLDELLSHCVHSTRLKSHVTKQAVVAHAFSLRTQEAEFKASLKLVSGQPELLLRETQGRGCHI